MASARYFMLAILLCSLGLSNSHAQSQPQALVMVLKRLKPDHRPTGGSPHDPHEYRPCTSGLLSIFVNNRYKGLVKTVEPPWRNNEPFISSIPLGTYSAVVRYDRLDQWRLQLTNVPGRDAVQLHIGNYPSQTQGCILVGMTNPIGNQCVLEDSNRAYQELRQAFYGSANPTATPNLTVTLRIESF